MKKPPVSWLVVTRWFPLLCIAQIPPGNTACPPAGPPPAFPLHTDGHWIVDRSGNRVKLDSVNWYGAEEEDFVPAGLELASLDSIAGQIKCMGFNSVRLPWSNQMVETNPVVSDYALAANPQFDGAQAMDVFDAAVNGAGARRPDDYSRQPHEQCELVLQQHRRQHAVVQRAISAERAQRYALFAFLCGLGGGNTNSGSSDYSRGL
jgi:hypothetical protein